MRLFCQRLVLAGVLAAGLVVASHAPGQAHWFTKLLKEAGEAGRDAAGTASRVGIGSLDEASSLLRRLPSAGKGRLAFAAHATPEGHWKFTNRDGAVFTAATPDEMGRVAKALAPDSPDGAALSLYLSEDTVFLRPNLIDELPGGTKLNMVFGRNAFELVRSGRSAGQTSLYAKVRSNVLVRIGERAGFREAVWQLGRVLPRGDVRVLSVKPGGPSRLASVAKRDPQRKLPLADEIDPAHLAEALPGIRGQTAVISGRIDGDLLHVLPSSGGEQAISLKAVRDAAARADVNLIVLHSSKPMQPGGQNWLWQTIEVEGLGKALEKATFGDFLDALAGGRGQLVVSTNAQGPGRVFVEALPDAANRDIVDSVGTWVGDAVSDVAGNVVTESVQAFMTSEDRQKELDDRIVPGIPSDYQFYYIGALVMGVIGLSVSRSWWNAIWPKEDRGEYRANFGYGAARAVRWLVFIVIFLPLVGPFALVAWLGLQIFNIVMMPFRALRWLFGHGGA